MTDYPHCRARGVLIETKGGKRASMSALYATMTPDEFGQWFRLSDQFRPMDDYGADPDDVERFLSRFPMPREKQRNLFA